jgi:5'-3' exonuclease
LFYTKKNNTKIIVDSSRLYIEGIYWTYAYYKRQPRNSSWYYPYGYSPTIQDLANNMQANLNEFDQLLESWKNNNSNNEFVDQIVQLLSILPCESKNLIPYNIQKLMTDSKYGCLHLFPKSYSIQTYLKTHLWECIPVLPPLDIQLIQFTLRKFNLNIKA